MELLEKTNQEIDAIVAEYHEKLPRSKAESIGSIYARYSSRFQDSIADQVRTLFEAAYKLKIFIPREFIYFDLAVRGWKDRRPGLTALRDAIKAKKFDVFLVFTTSRLFRRMYKALQFVEVELVERGIRGIFVKSGLDTADGDNWRTTFQVFAAMDEAMVRTSGEHVRAALEGLFLRRMVCTSLPLGYTGEVVPGELTRRNGPRRRIVVDPETALWIVKIYSWYVTDGKSLDDIARELNDDPDAPAPAKSLTGFWTHALVRSHLKNGRYRGYWVYGAKQTKWSSEKYYAEQIPRPEPLKSGQFENLRVVTDDVWYRAQALLLRETGKSGRRAKDGDRKSRPRLLRGLFVCPEHGRPLIVGGVKGSLLHRPQRDGRLPSGPGLRFLLRKHGRQGGNGDCGPQPNVPERADGCNPGRLAGRVDNPCEFRGGLTAGFPHAPQRPRGLTPHGILVVLQASEEARYGVCGLRSEPPEYNHGGVSDHAQACPSLGASLGAPHGALFRPW